MHSTISPQHVVAAPVYGFLAFTGFAKHLADIYLVPTVYQALHLCSGKFIREMLQYSRILG